MAESAFELVSECATHRRHGRVPFHVVVDTHPAGEVQLVQYEQGELQVVVERVGTVMFERHRGRSDAVQQCLDDHLRQLTDSNRHARRHW